MTTSEIALEQVKEFYQMLTGGDLPKGEGNIIYDDR